MCRAPCATDKLALSVPVMLGDNRSLLWACLVLLVAQPGIHAEAQRYVFPWSRAGVTHDAGRVGNVKHGNLPDPGDEMAWTLSGIKKGVYRVELDVRTGSRGEGTGYVPTYRLTAPDRCLVPGRSTEIGFHPSPDSTPRITMRGKGWVVFRGRVTAKEKLRLQNGDQLSASCRAHHGMAYALILTEVYGHDLFDLRLTVDKYVSLFVERDRLRVSATATSLGGAATRGTIEFEATDEHGARADHVQRGIELAPVSEQAVKWTPRLHKLGPFFVKAALTVDGEQVCSDEINLAVVPRTDLHAVPDTSPFGIHKSDLADWPPIGVKWNRLWDTGDTWNRMQPQDGAIDFSKQDQKLHDAQLHGVNLLFVFAYTPTWASSHPEWPHYTGGGATAAPRDITTWGRYIAEVVSRYKGAIEHFEVWNEPNAGFFKGTAEEYAQLLRSAYRTTKLANPDATVVGISGTGGYLPWMEKVFKLDGLRYMDVVSVHTYTSPSTPEQANLSGRLTATRRLIAKYGGRQPIWNTELGYWVPERNGCRPLTPDEIAAKAPKDIAPNWKSGWPYRPIDEYSAAAGLVRHYVLNVAGEVEHAFWYSWVTQAFPMYTVRGAPRMHTVAYAGAAARLSDARYLERIDLGAEDIHIHLFAKPSGPLAVVWRSGALPRSVSLDVRAGTRTWDMWGNLTSHPTGESLVLALTPRPVYVMGRSLAEMRSVRLAGEEFVFEATDADVTKDIGHGKVREMTSPPHHGDRRVVGLPDAGDELTWTLKGIDRAVYEVRLDVRTGSTAPGTDFVGSYQLRTAHGPAVTLSSSSQIKETRRGAKYSMFYGEILASPSLALSPGDTVTLSCRRGWAYVGKLILRKVAELADDAPIACHSVPAPPTFALSTWPEEPSIELKHRAQVVMGVVDRFASTSERDSWQGEEDSSAQARIAWTSKALHVLVHVRDDRHVPPTPKQGPWNGDCVELFFDFRDKSDVGTPALGDRVFQICCPAPITQIVSEIHPKGRCPAGVTVQGTKTDTGYAMLVAVPWAQVGSSWPKPGRPFGFDIAIDDADNVGEERAKRKAQIVWKGSANNFQDPSAYARFVLRP